MNKIRIAAGLLVGVSLVFAGCDVTIPKWPDGGTGIPPVLTNAIPPVVTETKPETADGNQWQVTWYGPSCANAKQTIKIYDVVVSGGKVTWKCDAKKWSDGRDMTVDNTLLGALFQRGDGANTLAGGKFDWVREGQRSKGLENLLGKRKRDANDVPIKDPDGDWIWEYYMKRLVPIVEGEDVWFVMFRSDGKEMSDIVKAVGKIDRSKRKGDK